MKKYFKIIIGIMLSYNTIAQFKGGYGDGNASSNLFSESFINIFAGGQGDGFATVFYNQVSTPLPIALINFTGKKVRDINQLTWQTSQEINASHFEIERSIDAKIFEKIGEVKANKSESYEFYDQDSNLTPQTSNLNYYRLKLLDLNGKYNYSKIIYIENGDKNEIIGNFYPNPTSEKFTIIDIVTDESGTLQIHNFDSFGKLINAEKQILEKGLNKISINNLQKGLNIVGFELNNILEYRKVIFK